MMTSRSGTGEIKKSTPTKIDRVVIHTPESCADKRNLLKESTWKGISKRGENRVDEKMEGNENNKEREEEIFSCTKKRKKNAKYSTSREREDLRNIQEIWT